MPIDRIIVAYDASALSREAFAYAIELAKASGSEITLLRVIEFNNEPPLPDPTVGMVMGAPPPMPIGPTIEEQRNLAARELPEAVSFGRKAGVSCHPEIVEGELIDELARLAGPDDLIAIGAKGRFADARIGSSTAALIGDAPCPVLVATGPLRDLSRVLCVFDESSRAGHALEWSKRLSEQTGWPLTVLAATRLGEQLPKVLQHAQDAAPDAMVVSYGPENEPEAKQIETAAEHARSALLVMGAFTDGWIYRLLFGGTTDHVLTHVQAPVVLVRKPPKAR